MKSLNELAFQSKTDKADHANYIRDYARFFDSLRGNPVRLLEIGVQRGFSISMWLAYFPKATIFGVDLSDCPDPKDARYVFEKGDQSDGGFWKRFITRHGGCWDIIIDDGGHRPEGIITSFESLWPHVSPGGFYAIEDLYCAYRPTHQTPGWISQMEFVKSLLDNINQGQRGIDFLHFSHELAVMRKCGGLL